MVFAMKVFLDSSLLIEFEKQAQTELFEAILASNCQVFINSVVISEYLYKLLGILGNRSPLSICESRKIGETLESHKTVDFLSAFEILPIPNEALRLTLDLMKKHNLLPNDAMILASCKLQNVAIIASFDSGFNTACLIENILLISNLADFQQISS
jgi:uncharacterized protein